MSAHNPDHIRKLVSEILEASKPIDAEEFRTLPLYKIESVIDKAHATIRHNASALMHILDEQNNTD